MSAPIDDIRPRLLRENIRRHEDNLTRLKNDPVYYAYEIETCERAIQNMRGRLQALAEETPV